jgi:hypothetical protein
MLCGLAAPMLAAAEPAVAPPLAAAPDAIEAPSFEFDLPAQPLALALDRFADLTGRAALFSSTLVAGRTSAAVRGRLAPLAALQALLQGTGLEAEEVSAGRVAALVLKPAGPSPSAPVAAAPRAGQENYDSLIQARVWEALCAAPLTAQGGYRSLLRFRIDAAGRVQRAQLLGGSGDARRDLLLVEALERVRIGRAPPPQMPQPVTMLILPEQGGTPACASRGR